MTVKDSLKYLDLEKTLPHKSEEIKFAPGNAFVVFGLTSHNQQLYPLNK